MSALSAAAVLFLVFAAAPPAAAPARDCGSKGRLTILTHYWAGPSYSGLALTRESGQCARRSARREDTIVGFIYGSCTPPSGEGGCSPPLEIQNWPACKRNLHSYKPPPGVPQAIPPPKLTTVRGVPAATFEGDPGRLEVYTGRTTVVIFASGDTQARAVADNLQKAPTSRHGVTASQPLPPPARGALEGKLRCRR